ncbi:hypothetical protein GCM10011586_27890 [Silvibacterium dinghuense]|nr:hypothetical protein GCM10011586_27890 [Silvibacterium dinghuense]
MLHALAAGGADRYDQDNYLQAGSGSGVSRTGAAGGGSYVQGEFPDSTRGTAVLSPPIPPPREYEQPADEGLSFGSFDMTNQTFLRPSLTGRGSGSETAGANASSMYERYLRRVARENAMRSSQAGNGLSGSAGKTTENGLGNGLSTDRKMGKSQSKGTLSNSLSPLGLTNPY